MRGMPPAPWLARSREEELAPRSNARWLRALSTRVNHNPSGRKRHIVQSYGCRRATRWGPDGLEIRVPCEDGYRTRAVCGGDCEPEPMVTEQHGVRVAFTCPEHGPHAAVEPFDEVQ